MSSFKKLKKFLPEAGVQIRGIVIALAVIVLLALFRPSDPSYSTVHPHPFLLIASFLCAVLGVRGAMSVAPMTALIFLVLYRYSVDPESIESLWNATSIGMTLGIALVPFGFAFYCDRLRMQSAELEEQRSGTEKLLREVEFIRDRLRGDADRLTQQLSQRFQAAGRAFEYADALNTDDGDRIARGLVDLVSELFGEDQAVVYTLESNQLVRRAQRTADAHKMPRVIARDRWKDTPWLARAMELGDVVMEGGSEGTLAVPLVDNAGRIQGVLAIPELGFLNHVHSTFATLRALGRWAGACLARAGVSEGSSGGLWDEATGLFRFDYLLRRLRTDYRMARKHKFPLLVLRFKIPELSSLPEVQRVVMSRLIARSLTQPTADVGAIAAGRDGSSYFVLMFEQDQSIVSDYVKKVMADFDESTKIMEFKKPLQILADPISLRETDRTLIEYVTRLEAN